MIYISELTPVAVWERSCSVLYAHGFPVPENGFYRNESAALEVRDTSRSGAWYTSLFPLSKQEVAATGQFLVYGDDAMTTEHEWTKIYRRRIFEEHGLIDKVIELLIEWPDCPRAQISIWNPDCDYIRTSIAPCLQILWFKIIARRLDLHVHMRTSDCYGKLLMNMNEFLELQHYVAGRLGLPTGMYRQFVDSLHFHINDANAVDKLAAVLRTNAC